MTDAFAILADLFTGPPWWLVWKRVGIAPVVANER